MRRLRADGLEVRCALTRGATSFVTPLTMEVLSGAAVYQEEYLSPTDTGEELHIEAARWADVLVIAPATANTLGKLALGLADDFLTTTFLAFEGPVIVAPAMSSEMWEKPAVQANVQLLERRGVTVLGPATGLLASGEYGVGRMVEPEDVASAVTASFRPGVLDGRTVLVSAGPTRESADPVRFLSSRSSGRMGFALAAAAHRLGARSVLVAGPVELPTPPGVERVDVIRAEDMLEAVKRHAPTADMIIMAAAVSDFRPRTIAPEKIKKADGWRAIELERTPDILAELPAVAPQALIVGFAAETSDVGSRALRKMKAKGAHFMVANDVSRSDIGFGSEYNEVVVYSRDLAEISFERQPKNRLAASLMELFATALDRVERAPAPVDR